MLTVVPFGGGIKALGFMFYLIFLHSSFHIIWIFFFPLFTFTVLFFNQKKSYFDFEKKKCSEYIFRKESMNNIFKDHFLKGPLHPSLRSTCLRGDVECDSVQASRQHTLSIGQRQRDTSVTSHTRRGHDQVLSRDGRWRHRCCWRKASTCSVKFYKRGEVSRSMGRPDKSRCKGTGKAMLPPACRKQHSCCPRSPSCTKEITGSSILILG